MDNKIIAIIAVAVIAVAAVGAAIAFSGGSGSDSKDYVYYDANGGTSAEGTEIKTTQLTCFGTNIFTKEGFSCIGWNTDKNAKTAAYHEGDAVKLGMRLYAIWKDESGQKLKVTASNSYTSVYNLALNNTDIDKAGEYDLKGGDKIYITANAGSATFGVDGSKITIKVAGSDKTYTFTLMDTAGMTDLSITQAGTSAVISFGFTVGTEVHFGYAQGELHG